MPYRIPADIPDDVSAWFRAKGLEPSFDFWEVWRDEHQVAFTVAKMAELDLLGDMHQAMADAIEQGQSLGDFVATQTERLQDMGWWGDKVVRDPKTGEPRTVRLGSPARLRLIYNTNLRTALAAGQWDRIEETQDAFPYLLYQLGPSRVHRPVHVTWHGILLPADDPWWRTHFPPNGWGCRCWIRQVSQVEADRNRWDVSERPPERFYTTTDPRTGLDISMPVGLEPGWDVSHRRSERRARLRELLADKRRG